MTIGYAGLEVETADANSQRGHKLEDQCHVILEDVFRNTCSYSSVEDEDEVTIRIICKRCGGEFFF
jgi:hypothetical protein